MYIKLFILLNKIHEKKKKKETNTHGVPKRSPIQVLTVQLDFGDRTRTSSSYVVWSLMIIPLISLQKQFFYY